MEQYRLVNRVMAVVAFIVTLITFAMTLQPSVPFWDCGEFTPAAAWQQVPHPPGAPLWLLVGRLLYLIPIGDPGWRINMFSALCGAFTSMLVYMISVKFIERWKPYRDTESITSYLPTFGGAIIAALAFTWSDSNWFNSVESEVYAGGTLLIALPLYLALAWDQKAELPGHERYLLMIAYIMGLSMGVHLLALLTVPSIAMIIYFRKFRSEGVPMLMGILGGTGFVMAAVAYFLGPNPTALILVMVIVSIATFIWGVVNFKTKPGIVTFSVMTIVVGIIFMILVYNGPLSYIPKFLSGDLFGTGTGEVIKRLLFYILIGAGAVASAWTFLSSNRNASTSKITNIARLSLTGFFLLFLGFTTYTQVLLRANAKPPMNENDPDTLSELVSYLGRDQYGNARSWPRRYQPDDYYQSRMGRYGEWTPPIGQDADGYVFDPGTINHKGEWNFMFKYQISQMYFRYFSWNFVGRVSDIQDAGVAFAGISPQEKAAFVDPIGNTGYPVRFYALPLILGLIGLVYHFRRDWKMAFTMVTMFLIMGVIAALQQKQQEPQPRERDYFYIGSFMVFCIWMGVGAAGLAEEFGPKREEDGESVASSGAGIKAAVVAACLAVGPLNMAINGWKVHDRSGNWVPWDYSYNILQSCEKDAILFTNGDNDTFPLWYLQDVAGIRRDVRVVNLSLGQTLWYIYQLKNEMPWGAKKVPINFSDEELLKSERESEIQPSAVDKWPVVTVPVPASVMKWATDGKVTSDGSMTWELVGGGGDQRKYLTVYHLLIRNIIENNKWQRPVYFSATVGQDAWGGLEGFFRREGMAYRIMPVRQGGSRVLESINPDIMRKCLMETLPDDQSFAEPHYGMKFRNLTNTNLFYMEDHRRLMLSYRTMYLSLAQYEYEQEKNPKVAAATLDKMEQQISPTLFPIPYPLMAQMATVYGRAGNLKQAKHYGELAIQGADAAAADPDNNPYAGQFNPIQVKSDMYMAMGEYDKAAQVWDALMKQYPNDPNVRAAAEEVRVRRYSDKDDKAGAAAELKKIVEGYNNVKDQRMLNNREAFNKQLQELTGESAIKPADGSDDTSKASDAGAKKATSDTVTPAAK